MDWKIIFEIIGIIGGITAFVALMLAPMFYLGSKMDAAIKAGEEFRQEVHRESKDFHGRLCILEERYLQMMQILWEKNK